jgi:ferrochelatase
MDEASGPTGSAYTRQHRAVAEAVMDRVAEQRRHHYGWDLVFCSRSGSPRQPWLEPDVNDHLLELAKSGTDGVVLAPIGFVSDHMEVVHDLDTEAASFADGLGIAFVRVPTVGTDPRFVRALADALLDRAGQTRAGVLAPPGATCGEGCCRS